MRTHQIMARKLITVKVDTPIVEAAKLMLEVISAAFRWSTMRVDCLASSRKATSCAVVKSGRRDPASAGWTF